MPNATSLECLGFPHERPITEYLLEKYYKQLRRPITLLGVSPLNDLVIKAALTASKDLNAPIMFIASLNQVDTDGGYTGWTPKDFVEYVCNEAKRLGANVPIIVALDHGGPWLKDEHILNNLSYEDAMEEVRKSIEAAIKAGYHVIHVDTTVDPNINKPPPELVAKRTLDLIEFSEEVRKAYGLRPLNYEVGSDRWGLMDIDSTRQLLSLVLRGIRDRGINEARVLFVVGNVGTEVKPGNRLNVNVAVDYVKLANDNNLYLKVHSADYIENPGDFPRLGIGGANIGPMFADVMFNEVRELLRKYGNGDFNEEYFIELVINRLMNTGKWRKYVKSPDELVKIKDSYVLGLMTRYIWSDPVVSHYLSEFFNYLNINRNIRGYEYVEQRIMNIIKHYLMNFNLVNACLS